MAFKWGNSTINKVELELGSATYEVKKVVYGTSVVFEDKATYVITPYFEYNWTGTLNNQENWDGETGEEILTQSVAGNITLTYGLSVTRNGVAYTPTSSECSITATLAVRDDFDTDAPSINDGWIVWDIGNFTQSGSVKTYTKSMARGTSIDTNTTDESGYYWWLIFSCKSASFTFKGTTYSVGNLWGYVQSVRDCWTTFDWTPFTSSVKKNGTSKTIIA